MTAIRVLHIVDVDKQNYYLANLAEYSDPAKVEYSFVTFAPDNSDFVRDFKERGLKVTSLNCVGRSSYPKAYRMLRKLLREDKPDVVHTHLFDPSLIGLTAAKRSGLKTVLTRHHSDAIHELPSPLKRRFYLSLENYVSRKSDHIIAPSRMVRDFLVDVEGVPERKVSVIPYGQTTERYDAVTAEKIKAVRNELGMEKNLTLVFVSRLYHRKGHKYLFQAFADLVKDGLNADLYLVGDGDEQPVLEKMTAELGIADRVHFLGWRDDALTIIAASDIVVHPSLEDALSSAVIESLMLEKPVIATDISGVRDSLDDGKYGKIVKPADAEAFRSGIKETIENLAVARQAAVDGRQYLLKYMDSKRVADQTISIYEEIS